MGLFGGLSKLEIADRLARLEAQFENSREALKLARKLEASQKDLALTIIDGRLDKLNDHKATVDTFISNTATRDYVDRRITPLNRMQWGIIGVLVFWKVFYNIIDPFINKVSERAISMMVNAIFRCC